LAEAISEVHRSRLDMQVASLNSFQNVITHIKLPKLESNSIFLLQEEGGRVNLPFLSGLKIVRHDQPSLYSIPLHVVHVA
jgi:hypothetical protein